MCVIIAKNAGVRPPSIQTLRSCWRANPDGAGFMYSDERGKVIGVKGFMTWADFGKEWRDHAFTAEDTVVIHFRLATSGGIRPENCHPFPVTRSVSKLRELEFSSDLAIAHNGVFGRGKGTLSDTMLWVKDFLSTKRHDASKESLSQLEDDLGGNRVAIMGRGLPQPLLLGFGWQKLQGLWFSNLRWAMLN